VRRDLNYIGNTLEEVAALRCFDAFYRYWEVYHYTVATSCLSANSDITHVAYGQSRMEELVRSFYYRFGHRDPQPERFEVFGNQQRHPDWMRKAEPVVRRVAEVWATAGLHFPFTEVMEAW